MWSDFRYRFRSIFRRKAVEHELAREVEFHLERQIQKHVAAGMSREDAERRARLEFGSVDETKEQCREARGIHQLDIAVQDLRYSFRFLARNRSFTCFAVLTLALGIGGVTAVFAVIDALLLRPLPVAAPRSLVSFTKINPISQDVSHYFTYGEFEQFRSRTRSLSGLFGYMNNPTARMKVSGAPTEGRGEPVRTQRVIGEFFETLGVRAVLGRTFNAEDLKAEEPVVVLSYDFWRRRFDGDARVLGRKIVVFRDIPFAIIGIAPPGFFGVEVGVNPDMWWPLTNAFATLRQMPDANARLMNIEMAMMGRIRPGIDLVQARAEAAVIFPMMRLESGATGQTTASGDPSLVSSKSSLRGRFTQPLLVLMASVTALLVIASTNTAALLLARAGARQKELTVRLALGSGRKRLVRQLITESVVLAAMSGIAGLVIAHFGIHVFLRYAPPDAAHAIHAGLDVRVIGFAMGAAFLTALLFGLAPALKTTQDLNPGLKQGSNARPRPRLTIGKLLVSSQIGLSLILLIGAGLLVGTLQHLRRVDAGFNKRDIVLFDVNDGTVRPDLGREILSRLEAIPGVRSATFFADLGLLSGNSIQSECAEEGGTLRRNAARGCVLMNVGPRFFETLEIPLVAGRSLRPSTDFAFINEAMARDYFGDQNPIGRRITTIRGRALEIIGVVGNAKYATLREQPPRILYSVIVGGILVPDLRFAIRTQAGAGASLDAAIRDVVRQVTPQFEVTNIESMNAAIEATLIQERLLSELAGFFSLLAVLLACIGLYGTMSYAVAQRTNEIGIRMALGARVVNVISMVMGETAWVIGIGLVAGLLGAIATTRMIASFLFGLTPTDPLTTAAAILLLTTTTLCAAYLPARQASRVDPVEALRHD